MKETAATSFIVISLAILLIAGALFRVPSEAFGATLPAEGLRLVEGEGEQPQLVASLSNELSLSRDLDLPPSETFSLEEPEQLTGDFELKLPEEDLPESDIPLTLNSKVEYFITYFQTSGRDAFARWLSRSERYIPMMKQVLKKEGLPEDLVYVAMIESGFSPNAYSVASAVGPWQFMSGTGKNYSLRINQWIDERRDPLKSTMAAGIYLKELYNLFNKDWYLAAAGYNAGENKILRAIGRYNSRDFWELSKGSYLKRETKDYVPKLLAAAIIAKDPARYGFSDVAFLAPIELDTVKIPTQTDLEVVARICDIPPQTLRDLNPELRRWCTPPNYPNYELKIPKGKKAAFEADFAKIPEDQRHKEKIVLTRYRARRKDTLASIARRFGTTPETIAELNNIGKRTRLKGKLLTIPGQGARQDAPADEGPSRAGKVEKNGKEFNKYYTVKRGDTLTSLAKRFNISAKFLAAWNNLKVRVALRPGKRIIIAKYVEKQGGMIPVTGGNG